jgi:hypothetical protein
MKEIEKKVTSLTELQAKKVVIFLYEFIQELPMSESLKKQTDNLLKQIIK